MLRFIFLYDTFCSIINQNVQKGGAAYMPSRNAKQTSKSVATKASKILTDKRYGQNAKSVAGSALAQTKPSTKKK